MVWLEIIFTIILYLAFYSIIDFLIHNHTSYILNLVFIIPLVFIKFLVNSFYPTEWIGLIVGLIGTTLLYHFIFLPFLHKHFSLKNTEEDESV